jgi:hypothetical protein
MDQQQTRRDRMASADRSRSTAQERRAAQMADIAGKQGRLKHEAQQRREKKDLSPKGRAAGLVE